MGIVNMNQLNLNNTNAISKVWQFNGLVAADSTAGCAYLTPDSLMLYCQSRLQGIDSQVNEAFAKQQESNTAQSILGKLAASPAFAVPGDKIASGNDADARVQAIKDAIDGALANLDPNSAAYKALSDYEANSIDKINTSQDISVDQFNSTVVGGLSSIQKDLNSSSELSMIGLQSLMSQRQQAIQVCTNLVQALGDQCQKIAENVGH